jgi:hypothetical protein
MLDPAHCINSTLILERELGLTTIGLPDFVTKRETWAQDGRKTLVCSSELECGGQRGQQIRRDLAYFSSLPT